MVYEKIILLWYELWKHEIFEFNLRDINTMYESTSGVAVDRPNRDRDRDRDVAVRGDRDRAPGFEIFIKNFNFWYKYQN